MAATTTRTMALTVRRRFARTATLAIIPMHARRTVIGGQVTSWTEYSLELARGTDGDTVTDTTAEAGMVMAGTVADFAMVAGSVDAGLVVADSRVGRDLGIGAASPIAAADSVAAFPEAADSAAVVEAFMAAVDSTEVVVGSMAAVVAVSTAVVAGTAAATGN
jgi:hypothetical protein